jgi:hypothetical protein
MTWLFLLFACGNSDLDSGELPSCSEDCSLPGCEADPACEEITPQPEDCSDGIDNDLDGDTDCADSDCSWQPICFEDCNDGVDNDVDGLVDCEDADCTPECSESDCTDGLDNNANALVDCDDTECWGLAGCEVLLGVRIVSGSASLGHNAYTTQRDTWSSQTERQWLRARDIQGTATIALPESNIVCDWEAGELSLIAKQRSIQTSSRTSYCRFSNELVFQSFHSSGACKSWLDSGLLNFSSQADSPEALVHTVEFGDWVHLGGARWAAGTVSSSYQGANYSSKFFQIDPLLTEPWVFSP